MNQDSNETIRAVPSRHDYFERQIIMEHVEWLRNTTTFGPDDFHQLQEIADKLETLLRDKHVLLHILDCIEEAQRRHMKYGGD